MHAPPPQKLLIIDTMTRETISEVPEMNNSDLLWASFTIPDASTYTFKIIHNYRYTVLYTSISKVQGLCCKHEFIINVFAVIILYC